jgi:hypothetical protein
MDAMSRIEWTTERPEVEGYYWALEACAPEDADILMVHVSCATGVLHAWIPGDPDALYFDYVSHWMGPIEKPPYP